MMASENKNKKLFRVVVLKPGKQRSQASIVLFHSRPGQRKSVRVAHNASPPTRFVALQDTHHH